MSHFPPQMHEVNAILTEYVSIHEEIFGFSWRKIIPIPGLFRAIDYGQHYRQLGLLVGRLNTILNSSANDDLPLVFSHYLNALLSTVGALRDMCESLLEKSKGGDYPLVQYRADVARYESLVREYSDLGAHLNRELGIC